MRQPGRVNGAKTLAVAPRGQVLMSCSRWLFRCNDMPSQGAIAVTPSRLAEVPAGRLDRRELQKVPVPKSRNTPHNESQPVADECLHSREMPSRRCRRLGDASSVPCRRQDITSMGNQGENAQRRQHPHSKEAGVVVAHQSARANARKRGKRPKVSLQPAGCENARARLVIAS